MIIQVYLKVVYFLLSLPETGATFFSNTCYENLVELLEVIPMKAGGPPYNWTPRSFNSQVSSHSDLAIPQSYYANVLTSF